MLLIFLWCRLIGSDCNASDMHENGLFDALDRAFKRVNEVSGLVVSLKSVEGAQPALGTDGRLLHHAASGRDQPLRLVCRGFTPLLESAITRILPSSGSMMALTWGLCVYGHICSKFLCTAPCSRQSATPIPHCPVMHIYSPGGRAGWQHRHVLQRLLQCCMCDRADSEPTAPPCHQRL